jgi:hypothetical protein
MFEQTRSLPAFSPSHQEIVQRHRRAKRLILTALHDTPRWTAPNACWLTGWAKAN